MNQANQSSTADEFLKNLESYVKESLKDDKSGHDYAHTKRVLKNAMQIAKNYPEADIEVLTAACWLHDIAFKRGFVRDHHLIGAKDAEEYLKASVFPVTKVAKVIMAIEDHVRKAAKPLRSDSELSTESKILNDADNLDALGKIGIKRQLDFCKANNIPLFLSKEDKFNQSAYGGFKEIITWADKMLTPEGKKLAQSRVKVMKEFVKKIEEKSK